MGNKLKLAGKGLATVIRKPHYTIGMILIAAVFFILNLLIPNAKTLFTISMRSSLQQTVAFITALLIGGIQSMTTLSLIILIIISLLVGIVIMLIIFRMKTWRAAAFTESKASYFGTLLGLAAPGCASCGIGVLSAIGLTSSLVYLPFKGVEIGVISILLLLFSIKSLAAKIALGPTCSLPRKKKQ